MNTWIINGTDGPANSIGGTTLSTWSERTRSANEIQQELQGKVGDVEGNSIFVFQVPALPRLNWWFTYTNGLAKFTGLC